MADTQLFVGSINTGHAIISTSNLLLDGTGSMGIIFTAGPAGGTVDKILIKALSTTSSGVVSIFLSNGVDAPWLITQTTIDGILPSTIATTFETVITTSDIFRIPPGWSLLASTTKSEFFSVTAFGWDY